MSDTKRVFRTPAVYFAALLVLVGGIAGVLVNQAPAHASEGICATADTVVSSVPGADLTVVGNPANGLAWDGSTYSLGHGGMITVWFTGVSIIDGPGNDILIAEGGVADGAEVLVSSDGTNFASLGTHSINGASYFDIGATGLASVSFVKIVDDNIDADLGVPSAEAGFDLDGVEAYNCGEPQGTGRFTGGGHQIQVDGVRVTKGLTIHCDLLLSNNLEINWQGNKFHMTEHLQTVACTDDPDIIQAPPPAPLDTLVGVGTGRYNNDDGYTVEFTLVDQGEPGKNDQAGFRVYETANPGNVVLDVPLQTVSGGNLQAHYDQPHK